jgi:parallel beta helix pectate lyase-like protein
MVRRVSPVIIALAIASCLALGAGQASANHVGCGDMITTDTKLDSNLTNCPNNGIVIGANKITLDLNGHTIDGDDELVDTCPGDEFCDVGVANDGHNGIRVKDGKIREFAVGAFVFDARENRLRGLALSRHLFSAIILAESPRSQLRRNSVFANGLTTDQAGIDVFDSHHVSITRNRVSRNGDIGLFMPGFDHGRIRNNRLRRNPEAAMIVEGDRNVIGHNHLSRNGGLVVAGNRNTIARNQVASAPACPEGCGLGITVEAGRHNVIAHNVVARSSTTGIRVGLYPKQVEGGPRARDTVVRDNRLQRGNKDGVLVMSTAKDTLLRRNRARRSKQDGFDVNSPATTLRRNLAVHNGDLGVEAVRGVTDGHRNRAHGNGDPRQCKNIACK